MITKIPYTDCTVDSVNEDIVFVCSGASFLNPSSEASTWFYDGLQAGMFAALSFCEDDVGFRLHNTYFQGQEVFLVLLRDEAVYVKTVNCGVLSTKAHGEI